jgi:hypothetical protein
MRSFLRNILGYNGDFVGYTPSHTGVEPHPKMEELRDEFERLWLGMGSSELMGAMMETQWNFKLGGNG